MSKYKEAIGRGNNYAMLKLRKASLSVAVILFFMSVISIVSSITSHNVALFDVIDEFLLLFISLMFLGLFKFCKKENTTMRQYGAVLWFVSTLLVSLLIIAITNTG